NYNRLDALLAAAADQGPQRTDETKTNTTLNEHNLKRTQTMSNESTTTMNKLEITRKSPNVAVITRRFGASPERVYDAHVKKELIAQWVLGPDGWSMPVCEVDARPGGSIRYEWRNDADGSGFSLTGEFEVLERPHRIVHVERMHLPDTTPDNHVETTFEPDGDGTLLTMRMTVPSAEVLEAMLATGMTDGMELSFQRLEGIV